MKMSLFGHGSIAVLILFATFFAVPPAAAQVTSANAYAVTTLNQLVQFNTSTPGTVVPVGTITNLQAGENILGIDFRPASGELYALGSTGRLYVINRATAAAAPVAQLSTAISGTSFGFDFNPTVDRIRIVSDTGQNLRVNPLTGAVTVDGPINGGAAGAEAAGYTNSFGGAASTTLYSVSAASNTLYIQNPPNNGTLVAVGAGLGVDITDVNGFDILSADSSAFGIFTGLATTNLYSVNLTTGTASSVGTVGNGLTQYRGFAVEIGQAANYRVYGVTTANNLIQFNSRRPGAILRSVAITGLQGGENIVGIDVRPATGQLFGLGSTSRIYRINPFTGAATFVGTLTTALAGTNFGFDFNPVPDRIRITSDADQNLRANPADGTNLVDGTLAYAAGDPNAGQNPNIVGSGYTNSFGGTTTTTLYDIDSNLDILVTQNPPNNGTLNTVGSLGVNITAEAGFDIASSNNTALAAFQVSGSTTSALYTVDLTTGSAAVLGPIGGGAVVRDIAIAANTGSQSTNVDFDGDGRTDKAIFRLSNNFWIYLRSSDGSYFEQQWGIPGDRLVPGDYDNDGKTDIAVWRESNGTFYIIDSSTFTFRTRGWGLQGDEPVARDYDGDGDTDFGIARRANGFITWYITNFEGSFVRINEFGLETDIVAPGDYDGDGVFDLAVRRGEGAALARFYLLQSTAGYREQEWGFGSDFVVPGDYDGDGRTDFTALRTGTNYQWFVLRSSDGGFYTPQVGQKPDLSAQGDWDGDGKTDVAVWNQQTGTFTWLRSSNVALVSEQFGLNGDIPVAGYDTH